jgi:hypothetical protein
VTDYSIWPATDGPFSSSSDGQPINVGTEVYQLPGTPLWAVGVRWFRGTTNVNADNLRLYRVDSSSSGTVLAEVLSPAASGTGWQFSAITPVLLSSSNRYKAAAHLVDHYVATGGYWTAGGPGAGGITNGPLVAPDTGAADGGGQGTFKYGAVAFPDGSFNGGNYWVDIVLTDVDPAGGITVQLDLAVETDSAHVGAPAHIVPLDLAAELDSGQQLVVAKVVPLSLAVESDSGLPVAVTKTVVLDQAVEIDTAHAGSHYRSVSLAQAVEVDSALPITVGGALLVPGTHAASATVAQLTASSTVARLEAR